MKRGKHLQLFVAATMLVAAKAFGSVPPPTLPKSVTSAPESPPPAPAQKPSEAASCPSLNLNYFGFKAPQDGGDIIFPPKEAPPPATAPSDVLAATSATTPTAPKPEGTTATTTIDATTTAGAVNATVPMEDSCVIPVVSDGKQYNWWQILLDFGGKPGTLNGTEGPGTKEEIPIRDPCARPLEIDTTLFASTYNATDYKTFVRTEETYPRFKGTASYFVDVRGVLVWIPPPRAADKRGYKIDYFLDDTGFWVEVENTDCAFEPRQWLSCNPLPTDCGCFDGKLQCLTPDALPSNLLASLVG